MLDITCISDLHGYYPKLEGGDLLIIAGDLTARHTDKEWNEFGGWMNRQSYKKIVFIAGNHDTMIEKWDNKQHEEGYQGPISDPNDKIEYLCDSATQFEGLKIWGSPWTKFVRGMNRDCMAFTLDKDEELAEKWDLIPDDIDILITHSPPYEILDRTIHGKSVGCPYLKSTSIKRVKPRLHVFGHIHEAYGMIDLTIATYINCSHVNERYQPVNQPIKIQL